MWQIGRSGSRLCALSGALLLTAASTATAEPITFGLAFSDDDDIPIVGRPVRAIQEAAVRDDGSWVAQLSWVEPGLGSTRAIFEGDDYAEAPNGVIDYLGLRPANGPILRGVASDGRIYSDAYMQPPEETNPEAADWFAFLGIGAAMRRNEPVAPFDEPPGFEPAPGLRRIKYGELRAMNSLGDALASATLDMSPGLNGFPDLNVLVFKQFNPSAGTIGQVVAAEGQPVPGGAAPIDRVLVELSDQPADLSEDGAWAALLATDFRPYVSPSSRRVYLQDPTLVRNGTAVFRPDAPSPHPGFVSMTPDTIVAAGMHGSLACTVWLFDAAGEAYSGIWYDGEIIAAEGLVLVDKSGQPFVADYLGVSHMELTLYNELIWQAAYTLPGDPGTIRRAVFSGNRVIIDTDQPVLRDQPWSAWSLVDVSAGGEALALNVRYTNRIDDLVIARRADPCVADITRDGSCPGCAGYGMPDGRVTVEDLTFFVEAWIGSDANLADLTTGGSSSGADGYGVPDGLVSVIDLTFFVEARLAGCS
ncbi:MAG: GC-type dockerin domain-anchored protein [Planctomycetota bacterium]